MSEHVLKENRIVPIDSLHPHPQNYRSHPDEQVNDLVASLQRFGPTRSIVVQDGPNGYLIVAGHGLVEAAKKLQYTELRADIIPANWTPEQVKGYLVADNNLSNKSSDDDTLLAELLQEQANAGYDLASLGTDDEALRQMLEALGDEYLGSGEQDGGEEDDFEAEPDEEQTRVQVGDVWSLGRHVIACVNSCDPDAVKKLIGKKQVNCVFADPPYGISIVATNGYVGGGEAYDIPFGGVKNRKVGTIGGANPIGSKNNLSIAPHLKPHKYAPIIGDDTIDTAVDSVGLSLSLFPDAVQIWWGANYYAHVLPPSPCWIVWDKETNGNFADAELAWCSQKSAVRIFKHMWNGLMKDSEKGQRRVHPSQKPCALAEWCYERYGSEGDIIFDPFLGSWMSLIAAENTNRSVIGCELSPEYINIILSRWEKHTGQTATLLERVEEVAHA